MQYDCKAYDDRREPLSAPKRDGSVWPSQSCPAFTPRKEHLPIEGSQCWFCRYAYFHRNVRWRWRWESAAGRTYRFDKGSAV